MYKVARYIAGRKLRADERYPLVLHAGTSVQCNLACSGCGKIDYPKEILQKRVSVEDAMRAVDECGAPIVSIPAANRSFTREMPQIVAGHRRARNSSNLCTNAILLSKHIDEYQPSPYLTFSIIWTVIGNVTTNRCARRGFSTRRGCDPIGPATRAFASPSIVLYSTAGPG